MYKLIHIPTASEWVCGRGIHKVLGLREDCVKNTTLVLEEAKHLFGCYIRINKEGSRFIFSSAGHHPVLDHEFELIEVSVDSL